MTNTTIHSYQNNHWSEVLDMLIAMMDYHIEIQDPVRFKKNYTKKLLPNFLRSMTQQHRLKTGNLLVAKVQSEIAGFSFAKPYKRDKEMEQSSVKSGAIEELFIREEYRRQGIAQLLITKQEQYLQSEGCELIRLKDVYATNDPAKKLYRKLGYIPRVIEYGKIVKK